MANVKQRPLLLGHRGMRCRGIAENTPTAFDMALQWGCDGFEFDVRLTADGQAIVCHDPRSKGFTLSKTRAAQLGHMPRMEDVLATFCKRAFLNIELKVPGLEREVLSRLHDFTPERGCVISSFLPELLAELRRLSAVVQLGIIFDRKHTEWRKLPVEYVIPHSMLRFASWGVDGIISDTPELLVKTLGRKVKNAPPVQDQS
jgi:glycerophosphoryl diester phosphodiesterase